MADIFDEIEEDLRRDRMALLWQRYGNYILGFAILIIVGVAGNQGYDYWKNSRAQSAGDMFFEAVIAENSLDAMSAVSKELPKGYEMLSRFRIAALFSEEGKQAEAEKSYLLLSEDPSIDSFYQQIALLLSVMNAPETSSKEELINRISSLAEFAGPLQGLALETSSGLYLELNQPGKALSFLKRASELTDIPPDLRQRISQSLLILDFKYDDTSTSKSE